MKYAYEVLSEVGGASDPRSNATHAATGTTSMRRPLNTPVNGSGRESEVLTFSALLTLLGRRSRQSIYDLMRRDPSFPKPRQIGSAFSVGWLRGEVMEWLNSRPRAEFNGLDAVQRRKRAVVGVISNKM